MAVARRRAINLPVGVPPVIEELVDEAAAEVDKEERAARVSGFFLPECTLPAD